MGEQVRFHGRDVMLAGERWPAVGGEPLGVVLLLHGGGQTRHSWHRAAERLAGEGWTTLTLDARGHGESQWAPDGDYSSDALVADLTAVIEQIGAPPVLVGASMGGMTSLLAQGENSALARALVLVDIVPRIEPDGVKRITDFMSANPDGFASLDEVADAVRAYNPHRNRPPSPDGLRKNVRQGADGRWRWHWDPAFLTIGDEPGRAVRADRARVAAGRLTVPTLLVRGAQTDIVSDEGVAELTELVAHAEYVEVDGTGHMVAGDDNDVFTKRVLEFLATQV